MRKIYHLYPEPLGSVCSLEELVRDAPLALRKMGHNKS